MASQWNQLSKCFQFKIVVANSVFFLILCLSLTERERERENKNRKYMSAFNGKLAPEEKSEKALLHTIMCLSIGTPKIINFAFVPNVKLFIFRCLKI